MAARYNITLDAGADYTLHLDFKDDAGNVIDYSGRSARMQVRKRHNSEEVIDELSTENGRILIDAEGMTLIFPHEVSIAYKTLEGLYDILVLEDDSTGSERVRVIEGTFKANPGITR